METITIYEKSMGKSHVHKPGEVMRHWTGYGAAAKLQYVTVVSMTKKLCRCEEPWSDDYDGQVWKNIITARPATPEEEAELIAEDKRSARKAEIKRRVQDISKGIRASGEKPTGVNTPDGARFFNTQDIYGGGDWFVIGPEYIWYVQNNGMDGDSWADNNVRTGGAGAIGWRVPADPALVDELRKLAAEYAALVDMGA